MIHFGNIPIGHGQRVYVTAELGVNACVSADRATNLRELERLVVAAYAAGADAVKLQMKSLDGYYAGDAKLDGPPANPERSPFRTRREYVIAREPDEETLDALDRQCAELDMQWTASPWDIESVHRLERWRPSWVKVASACIRDHELLRAVARMRRSPPIVMSTGGADHDTIRAAVTTLRLAGAGSRLVLAHCTMAYPAKSGDLALEQIGALRARFGVPVGWSSHAPDVEHVGLAVAAGACWYEAHLTMDRTQWGPDHAASLTPEDFAAAVKRIRATERVLGIGARHVMTCEEHDVERLVRRSG